MLIDPGPGGKRRNLLSHALAASRNTEGHAGRRTFPNLLDASHQSGPLAGHAGGLGPAPGAPGAPSTVDLSADPILQQIRALSQQHIQGAQTDELAARKKTLLDFGYDDRLKGLYPDAQTADAAKQNPFSLLANMKNAYEQGTKGLEDNLNKSNLFYSGARGTALADNSRHYQAQQADAFAGLNERLAQLSAALLAAKQQGQQDDLHGLADAYGRYQPPDVPDTGPASGQADTLFGLGGAATHPLPQHTPHGAHRRRKPILMP